MNNFKILLCTILFFQISTNFGQSELKLICSSQTKASKVNIDVLNNIYLIGLNGITKQSLCEKPNQSYSFIFNGDNIITDISSPFKILIYYSSNNTIEYLNSQLSILGNSIKISDYNNGIITLASSSYDNGIWVYSSSENILIRYNSAFTKTHQSSPIEELYNRSYNPNQLIEKQEQVYFGVPGFGVLIFDKYGSYQKRITIIYQQQFNVIGTKYYYLIENKLMAYDTKTFEEATILTEDSKILSFDINSKYIAIITQSEFYKLYQIPLN